MVGKKQQQQQQQQQQQPPNFDIFFSVEHGGVGCHFQAATRVGVKSKDERSYARNLQHVRRGRRREVGWEVSSD